MVPDRDPVEPVALDLLPERVELLRGGVLDTGVHTESHGSGPYARERTVVPWLHCSTSTLGRSCAIRSWWLPSRAGSTREWQGQARSRCSPSSSRQSAPFGRIDLADLMDLQQTRPTVHLVDGVSRRDHVAFHRAHRRATALATSWCVVGPEPSLRWRAVLGEIVDAAATPRHVTRAFTLGGIPSVASHRRPVEVLATGTSADVVAEIGAWRTDYTGPTGAQSALQVLLGEAGVPTIALWAQVPHYVAAGPSPPAIRALLARVRDLGGVTGRSLDPRRPGAGLHPARRRGHRRSARRRRGDPRDRVGHGAAAPERRGARVRDRALSPWAVLKPPRPRPEAAGRRAGAGSARPAHQAVSSKHPTRSDARHTRAENGSGPKMRTFPTGRVCSSSVFSRQLGADMSVVRINAITVPKERAERARGSLRRAGGRGVVIARASRRSSCSGPPTIATSTSCTRGGAPRRTSRPG